MKFTTQLACAAVLAFVASSAYAVQLGAIQVKSALNQPLVAAIPLHPANLTELDGLTVRLAPESAYQRAGLQLTAMDSALRFHVVTDNNGQKLILVTSSAPVTDPYLDFLIEVDTRSGKQVKEFVVLLNPVIAAPAPEVQQAPTASSPAAPQPAELPPASAFPQAPAPAVQSTPPPQPAQPPAPEQSLPPPPLMPIPTPQSNTVSQTSAPAAVNVKRGDTLYRIATQAVQANGGSVDQMMLALLAANPKAFTKNNINNLRAGAILRIPTRDQLDQSSLAAARAEVRRQNEQWRASKPAAPTEVAGAAATAAAATAPKPTSTATGSDHLAVVPPSTGAGGATNRPGVAGGTGHESVAGLRAELQNAQSALASVQQANADLASRVADLKDIGAKSSQLLSMKASTVAELQDKLAKVQARKAASAPTAASANAKAPATAAPWYGRLWTWIIAAIAAVLVILLVLLRLRRGRPEAAASRRVLPDPADVVDGEVADEPVAAGSQTPDAADELQIWLDLCRDYYEQHQRDAFIGAAHSMHEVVTDPGCVEWREVLVMGAELAPGDPLFRHVEPAPADDDPYGLNALRAPTSPPAISEPPPAVPTVPLVETGTIAPVADAADDRTVVRGVSRAPAPRGAPGDPVDTKLDLARAYIDMGDAVGARTMLDEVLVAGSQMQRDEARRLLDGLAG